MENLNTILHELGISKVKLAKYLGVSRQMIYNYLDLDDLNKWPKDKKVLLLNLLGIKSTKDLDTIKVDTDYINEVEARMEYLLQESNGDKIKYDNNIYEGLSKRNRELLMNIIDLIKEDLDDDGNSSYHTYQYLYHFLQAMRSSKELRYILSYVSKSACLSKPSAYVFDEDEEFIFESIMFSAMTLYHSDGISKSKITETHKRFLQQIEQKKEEKLSRTLELTTSKARALKELGYTEINEKNASEVLEKIVEIQSRNVT